MPLVINSLRDGHTHTDINVVDKSNNLIKNPVEHWPVAGTCMVSKFQKIKTRL